MLVLTKSKSVKQLFIGWQLKPSNATPEINAKTISDNISTMDDLEKIELAPTAQKWKSLVQKSEENSKSLMENKKGINETRVNDG